MDNIRSGWRNRGFGLIVLLSAVAAFPIGTSAQTVPPNPASGPTTDDYAALAARSQALTAEQKVQATSLFSTSFKLWQGGDFAAAEIGFKQGLDIDPANALANYYYGDCLQRRHDRMGARVYYQRAVTFGALTAEGLKAQAALLALASAPKDVADMTPEEIQAALVGHWIMKWGGVEGSFDITRDVNGIPHVSGKIYINTLKKINVEGRIIKISFPIFLNSPGVFTGNLTKPDYMEGTVDIDGSHFTAEKR